MLEFDLIRKDRERVYDLGWDSEVKALEIKMPTGVANFLYSELSNKDIKIIPYLQKDLGLGDFIHPNRNQWGFESLIEEIKSKNPDEISLRCQLSRVKDGITNPYFFLTSLSANLNLIFSCLSIATGEETGLEKQLLHIRMDTQKYSAPIGVTFGRGIVPWLNQQPDNYYDKRIEKAMYEAYCQISTFGSLLDSRRFSVLFRRPKWVNLDCPGNACGLDPENYYDTDLAGGYKLLPHNVDSVIQQLTLLVGIAALNDKARNELRGYTPGV